MEKKMTAHRPKDLRELADELAKRIDESEKPSRGQSKIAHLTPGELVIPAALLTPEVVGLIEAEARMHGIDPARLFVGSRRNSINPRTGRPEFFDPSDQPTEEITITAPPETGLVQLPQNLPNSGYYNYGTPGNGVGQYGLPAAMGVIGAAGTQWQATGNVPFGVGNMSKSDGSAYDGHGPDHMTGVGIDIRPIRTDDKQVGVTYNDPAYDRAATQALVDTLHSTGGVQSIYFNDPQISGVSPWKGHDNHLHVRVDPNYQRPRGR
jgi:penicillin-insensitive murein endopeptidase